MYDIIIIGGGIAGMTAAIYARRAGKTALILEKLAAGGQILQTHQIENYPALPGVSGKELAEQTFSQVKSLGAEIKTEQALKISRNADASFRIDTDMENSYLAKTIILATGTDYRHLGLPGEDELIGRGVSFCATCDGALYKGKIVAVYGGGNSALYSALYLADIAEKVYLIHRREEFRADAALVEKVKQLKNVEFKLGVNIEALEREDVLTGLKLTNGEELLADALFVAIGREPCDGMLYSSSDVKIEHDSDGYIVTDEACATSEAGIFAAGDCRSKNLRQIVTAAADGAIAASGAINILN